MIEYTPSAGDRAVVVRINRDNHRTYRWPSLVITSRKPMDDLVGIVVQVDGLADPRWFALGEVGSLVTFVEPERNWTTIRTGTTPDGASVLLRYAVFGEGRTRAESYRIFRDGEQVGYAVNEMDAHVNYRKVEAGLALNRQTGRYEVYRGEGT